MWLQFHSPIFPWRRYRSVYSLLQLLKLLLEPFPDRPQVYRKDKPTIVREHFGFDILCHEFPPMFFRIQFTAVINRFACQQCCSLFLTETYGKAYPFEIEHTLYLRKPFHVLVQQYRKPLNLTFKTCFCLSQFIDMFLLHIQQLTAVVCLHGLYLTLQCFDGFLVGGDHLMQCSVLLL